MDLGSIVLAIFAGLALAGGTVGKKLGGTKGMLAGAVGLPVAYILYANVKNKAAAKALIEKEQAAYIGWEKLNPGSTTTLTVSGQTYLTLKNPTPAERKAFDEYACSSFHLYCG